MWTFSVAGPNVGRENILHLSDKGGTSLRAVWWGSRSVSSVRKLPWTDMQIDQHRLACPAGGCGPLIESCFQRGNSIYSWMTGFWTRESDVQHKTFWSKDGVQNSLSRNTAVSLCTLHYWVFLFLVFSNGRLFLIYCTFHVFDVVEQNNHEIILDQCSGR